MSGVNDIRRTFLDFFQREGHTVVPSSPLVPRNDPTLMFTNSGMVQFKNVFTGVEKRPYGTATTAQKCVRAGGKHNDLDNVGYTARHHTFFEMLGNFSFANYFKDRAIELAWTLITREFDLPKDKLVVTVYSEDEEAAALWRKIAGLRDEKIIRIPTSDNFWQMGDTGPCGPCSEIFYDHGEAVPGGPPGSADADGDRFIEIWNLVFMQFEQVPGGERIDLPRPSIDTGMGLERVAAVLQGTHDNYDIDLFRALIGASVDATDVPAQGPAAASHRVIADHLRSAAFLVADGVLPGNEGRGYVLRRIMRRAMRHAQLLGAKDPLLWRLVPVLVREMGQAYPELVAGEALIGETLLLEETRFRRTLARGLSILESETEGLAAGGQLPGDVAFKLYDTFGFPLDLTQDALRARGIGVELAGFDSAMARQKADARAAWAGSGEQATEQVWFGVRDRVGATEFLGYSAERAEGQVLALVSGGTEVARLAAGSCGTVIVNQTPFYGQSGGQVGDIGRITAPGVEARVIDTQKKLGDLFVHEVEVLSGELVAGLAVELDVDHTARSTIRAHHSATHILHEALRQVLGDHVAQKGSLVAPDRLRFDFAQPRPVTDVELARIEDLANGIVAQNEPVTTRLMGVEEAQQSGARALFGEKYGDEVRVVSMGTGLDNGAPFSVELCGGTHVRRTGDIGVIRVVGESAVAAGVRRLEALTGDAARRHMAAQERALREIAATLKVPPTEAAERVAALVEDRRRLARELNEARKKLALGGGEAGIAAVKDVGGTKFLGRVLQNIPARDLKSMVDDAKKQLGSGIVSFVSVDGENKASIIVGVTDDRLGANNAVDLVRTGAEALGGKGGGGRPNLAQAGGPDGARAVDALAAIEAAIFAAA